MERFALNIDGGDEYYPWNEWIFFEYESREKFLDDLLKRVKRSFNFRQKLNIFSKRISSVNRLDKRQKVLEERAQFIQLNQNDDEIKVGGYDLNYYKILNYKILEELEKDPKLIDVVTTADINFSFFGTIEEMFQSHKVDSCEIFNG
jgi:hypothetical protein